MSTHIPSRIHLYLLIAVFLLSSAALLPASTNASSQPQSSDAHDGQHDFDFEAGAWKIHLKRLLHPLTGSNTWVEFDGTTVTRKVWDGRAQIEQFETEGSSGHIEGMTLRLYNPQSHQWSLYWANSKDGLLSAPTVGEFKNGRGEFFDQEPQNGRSIFVRYVWSDITPNSAHFEQSFSDDGGKTWEVNWITDQTRVSADPGKLISEASPKIQPAAGPEDGQHDFDFEFGSWKAHLRRLVHPLSGSNEWVDYEGTSVVRKLWNGRANIGEFEVGNATAHIEGLTLRLYNPQARQWRLYWANSRDGILATPSIGQWSRGRGEFFDQEDFNGKSIFVRFIFSDLTRDSFETEQAFSADGGKTWEPNWVSSFTRQE
ncbi:MAG TPA: hypothetical protein VMX38_01555 [Verrucomicrobiae bacterium]|jgi:hypothetical protein|nr:hypothetical protein [Verrucomicrobiae bacterium]